MSHVAVEVQEALMVAVTAGPPMVGEYGLAATVPLDLPPGDLLRMLTEMRAACREYEKEHDLDRGHDRVEWQRVSIEQDEDDAD